MGHAAAALLIIAQPLAVLATVLVPPVAMARRAPSRGALALWAGALSLLVVWCVFTYRGARSASQTGTEPSLLATAHWLGLALVGALGSVLLARRSGTPRGGAPVHH